MYNECLLSWMLGLQVEMSKGEDGMLTQVMAAFARPTRLVKSQKLDPSTEVDDNLFEVEEERQLQTVYQQVASQVMELQRHAAPPTPPPQGAVNIWPEHCEKIYTLHTGKAIDHVLLRNCLPPHQVV